MSFVKPKNKINSMKKILTITLVLVTLTSFSQSKEKVLSKADVFSSKSGTLIKKEYSEMGLVKKAKISIVHYTDMVSSQKISSIKIESDVTGKYSTSKKVAILDSDEIDGLIKSINIIQEKVLVTTPEKYTEVTYRSRGGFEAGCYSSRGVWKAYLKLEKFDSKSYVFLDKTDFPELLETLNKAKGLL